MTRSISERGAKTWRLMVFAFFGGEGATFRLTTAYISRSPDEILLKRFVHGCVPCFLNRYLFSDPNRCSFIKEANGEYKYT